MPYTDDEISEDESNDNVRQSAGGLSAGLVIAGVVVAAVAAVIGYFKGKNDASSSSHCYSSNSSIPRSRTPIPVPDEEDENVPTEPKILLCCICGKRFDFIRSKGGAIHTTPCGHLFCHNCIYRALTTDPRCPTCRRKVRPNETTEVFL